MTRLTTFLQRMTIFSIVWLFLLYVFGTETFTGKFIFLPLPLYSLILFGLYSAFVVLWRTFNFNDCPEAAQELKDQIITAKTDLKRKGYKLYKNED